MPEEPNPKLYTGTPIDPPRSVGPGPFPYAELDVTTNFSFLRGASHGDELVYTAAMLGYQSIAVTDINTLAGVVRAYDAAQRVEGFKLIVGTRLVFADGTQDILAWCPNRAAYGNLCRLLTLGKRRSKKGECHLMLGDLLAHSQDLLAAVAPVEVRDAPHLRRSLAALREGFGRDRLSLAVAPTFTSDDDARLHAFADLSQRCDVPLLATNHVHYHDPGRRRLQDVLTCIRHGCTVREAGYRLFPNGERHLKSPEQMQRLFERYPEAIERSTQIAGRCDFEMSSLKYEYPEELVPADKTSANYLAELAWAGADERYPAGVPPKVRAQVIEELELISKLRYEPYFLTIRDIVNRARELKILCQGRGSAANSAVCYCLGITSVDPALHDLLFARFLSEARNEPPDIDVDFEHERREEVIQYIYGKYGRDRAGMTATVITYRGRSAIRDVGKALGLPLDRIDAMAKRLDWWDRGTLDEVQLRECGIDPADPTVRDLICITAQLLGFPRHLSQHTGGMVMTRGPLCELVPIENAAMEERTVIEWSKEDIQTLGILKVDVLALGMLTAISKALELLNAGRHTASPGTPGKGGGKGASPPRSQESTLTLTLSRNTGRGDEDTRTRAFELHTLPHEDPETYEMMCDADTVGVFQIESRAQMSMLPRLQPREFYDIVIEVAIVRPGPIQGNMVHPYLQRRFSNEEVNYPSDELREVLKNTLGVPLFQEQAMKVVMVAAKFTACEADSLRRAMAAWRRSTELDGFHDDIVRRMQDNGYTPEFAEQVFNQIRGFGEYGFPESHAASFAKLVYASAWIKRHHPAVFLCAMLNSQPMGFYQPAQLVRDAKEHGVEVRAVDVNHSEWDCTLEDPPENGGLYDAKDKRTWGLGGPAVRLGFRQVKGMRADHALQLVEERRANGRFETIAGVHRRAHVPASVLRRLAEADAFGSLEVTRRQSVWDVLKLKDEDAPLFDQEERTGADEDARVATLPPMPLGQEVMTDYATSGLSLKRHPVALVRGALDKRKILTCARVLELEHGTWTKVAGLVLIRQRPGTASGVVFETLEDETGVVNLILWPKIYDQFRPAARYSSLLHADGYVQKQGKVIHVLAKRLFDLSGLLVGLEQRSRDFH